MQQFLVPAGSREEPPPQFDFDLDGGVIVSYRDLSAVVKVDRKTHKIAWRPNGHLLIFDNGWTHSPPTSRAVEYALDTVSKTATMVWQYSASPPIFNDFTGSVQRLANGNAVVAWTREGMVDEVRADGTLLSRTTLEMAPGRIATPYRVTRIKSLYGYARP